MYKGGEGLEWVVGDDGQLEVDYTFHKDTDSSAVSSLNYRKEYNSKHSLRQSLVTVCHHICHF